MPSTRELSQLLTGSARGRKPAPRNRTRVRTKAVRGRAR
jgi:hypothetical protein